MSCEVTCLIAAALLAPTTSVAQSQGSEAQLQKDQRLVQTLKDHFECKNAGASPQGDLYCTLDVRGLRVEITGVNAKAGGTFYLYSIGKDQIVGVLGRHCLRMVVNDSIPGPGAMAIIRDNGDILHNFKNRKAWADCE